MKSNKLLPKVLILILLFTLIIVISIGIKVFPKINHAMRISELLQPMLEAPNQAMHTLVSAQVGDETIALECDVYWVTDNNIRYLVLEQNGFAAYLTENILFLENGKAFKIGEKLQTQAASYGNLLSHIGVLFEVLDISMSRSDIQTDYMVTVTGEKMDTLLELFSPGESLPLDDIQTLNLSLTEKDAKLDQISLSGSTDTVQLNAVLSNFQMLAHPIPEAVRRSAAEINPEELFSLTDDLYRLVVALAPFADANSINGTLALAVDCGLIQLDTQFDLSDLNTNSTSQLDPEKLQALPGLLGWLCMEGDISCTQNGSSYLYALELDHASMEELSQMILPELAQYAADLTEGNISIVLESEKITSMKVSIAGKINALITKIPITVVAEFHFPGM